MYKVITNYINNQKLFKYKESKKRLFNQKTNKQPLQSPSHLPNNLNLSAILSIYISIPQMKSQQQLLSSPSSSSLGQSSSLSKVQKQIQNINRQIVKCYQHHHSAILKIQSLLGISNPTINHKQLYQQSQYYDKQYPTSPLQNYNQFQQQTNNSLLVSLNQQQILYYSCKYFVIFNITNKQWQIINKDVKNCRLKMMKKFNTTDNDNKLIVCVYQTIQTQQNTFITLLSIKTDYQSRTSRNDTRYSWKVIKLSTTPIVVQNYTYFPKKNYLYLVINKKNTDPKYSLTINNNNGFTQTNTNNNDKNTTQHLYIYDLNKQIIQINQQIRSNTVGFFVHFIALQDSQKVYLSGRNYFRQWTVNFNQKSIKESNVRNIERLLKNKTIVDQQQIDKYSMKPQSDHFQQIPFLNPHLQPSSPILFQSSKLLLILTYQQVLIIKENELICAFSPQQNIAKQSKFKQNIQKQLQKSFNQIHKMKFLFDEYEQMRDNKNNNNKREGYLKKTINGNSDNIYQKGDHQYQNHFTAISKSWKTQNNNYYIAIGNSKYTVLIYQLVDYQLKLYTEFDCSNKDNVDMEITNIVPLQSGDVLLCINDMGQVQLLNQQQNSDLQNTSTSKSLWGNAHLHNGIVYAITSPMIQNIMCTIGQDQTFKLWSMKKNQRSILFQSKSLSSRPLGITMHPGGTMVCVNFQREIKLYAILPHQFYQITNIKTNYCPMQLKYTKNGQFIVSNQGSVLIFYQSFSLKTLGYIEPADVQFKIIDLKISSNAGYICFLTEDNACFIQSIDIGDLSQWQHFSPVHRQVESYTAYWFDLIEREGEERKVRDLFVGGSRNKYMVLYDNLGSKLLAEFPIIDCYIVDIEVYENIMFCATSKGTIRVYNWPILQQQLQLQIISTQTNQIRYKPPKYDQYTVWQQSIPITNIHKLNFTTQLIVTNNLGNIAILSFQQTKNKKIIYQEISPERKKMHHLINQMFYIKKTQIEKRNKLIDKTQNDILKVQNQILRQKISLQRKMQQQQNTTKKGYQMKGTIQQSQKQQYIQKQQQEIKQMKKQIQNKKQTLQQLKQYISNDYEQKKVYEQGRNEQVGQDIRKIVLDHKQRIKRKIQQHKDDIRKKKKEYFMMVKQLQQQFDKQVVEKYEQKLREMDGRSTQGSVMNSDESSKQRRVSIGVGDKMKRINKQERQSNDLIMNLLADNVVTGGDIVDQIGNQNIRGLIDKLEDIQQNKIRGNNNYDNVNVNSNANSNVNANVNANEQTSNNLFIVSRNNYFTTNNNITINNNNNTPNNNNNININNKLSQNLSNTQNLNISITKSSNLSNTQNNNLYITQNNLSNNTQNNSLKSINITQTQQKQTKLKRTGIYTLNQKAFIKKKQQQQQQQTNKQLQQKINKTHLLMQTEFNNQIISEMTSKQNQDILIQSIRVEELQKNNLQLEKQILNLKIKVTEIEKQDQFMQKDFQTHLEQYNSARFKNLNLHCQVLKMQNQLVQRKQVLDNKQQIVMLAYQEKEKLQNYKQLVTGSLTKLQQRKQSLRDTFSKKQHDLNLIFAQLVNQIHKMENKKDTLQKLQRKMKQAQKEQQNKQQNLNQVIGKLKQVKKYLLLEKMNDQKSQKSIYQFEQSLVQTINFLKKRLFMESIKQKKNKQLKKSSLNQVLKQNKNLLEECNQLRSQGIEYENEIRNLSNKLKQANTMITLQTKLKSQKHDVGEQKSQLQIMKKLFKMQLDQFEQKNQNIEQQQKDENDINSEQQQQGWVGNNVREVYFDAENNKKANKSKQLNKKYTKVNVKGNNLMTKSISSQKDSQQNYNDYKPFKLSKYIEAQPYQKI